MKIKEGMYVRTDLGEIGKVTSVMNDDVFGTGNICAYNSEPFLKGQEVKGSYNIIDLIEVGDVISFKEDIDNYKKTYAIGIVDMLFLDEIKDKIKNDNIRLIGIATKEQFEANSYKIGDDK